MSRTDRIVLSYPCRDALVRCGSTWLAVSRGDTRCRVRGAGKMAEVAALLEQCLRASNGYRSFCEPLGDGLLVCNGEQVFAQKGDLKMCIGPGSLKQIVAWYGLVAGGSPSDRAWNAYIDNLPSDHLGASLNEKQDRLAITSLYHAAVTIHLDAERRRELEALCLHAAGTEELDEEAVMEAGELRLRLTTHSAFGYNVMVDGRSGNLSKIILGRLDLARLALALQSGRTSDKENPCSA